MFEVVAQREHGPYDFDVVDRTADEGTMNALDRKLCAAYDAFWHIGYRSRAGPDDGGAGARLDRRGRGHARPALHDAVRDVIAGELGLPKFDLRDTTGSTSEGDQLPPDARALAAVEQNDRAVRPRCRAVGRPING